LGYKGYYENYGDYIGEYGKKYDPHNIFVSALTDYGLVGFTLFMGIFLYPLLYSLKIILKERKEEGDNSLFDMAVICITSVIPLMLNGFFSGRLFFKPVILFILYTQISFVFQTGYLKSLKKKKLDA
jgi:O-antigen ligase